MAKKYYTLAIKPNFEGAIWGPQFGDYDREVVAQELEDTKDQWLKGSKFKIIKTGDKQADIDAKIAELNQGEAK
jgi:hypothetical protein